MNEHTPPATPIHHNASGSNSYVATTPQAPSKHQKPSQNTSGAGNCVNKYSQPWSPVATRDVPQYSVTPSGWDHWPTQRFRRLIEDISVSYDPTAFAEREGVPIEEVQHLVQRTVCDDLNAIAKQTDQRAEKRLMKHLMESAEVGNTSRIWARQRVAGVLVRADVSGIQLVMPNGRKIGVARGYLTSEDMEYLKQRLNDQQWALLTYQPPTANVLNETRKRKCDGMDDASAFE